MAFYSKHLDDQVQQSVFFAPLAWVTWVGQGWCVLLHPSNLAFLRRTLPSYPAKRYIARLRFIISASPPLPDLHNTIHLSSQYLLPLSSIFYLCLVSSPSFTRLNQLLKHLHPICGHRLSRGNYRSLSISPALYCFPVIPLVSGHFWTHVLNSLCLSLVSCRLHPFLGQVLRTFGLSHNDWDTPAASTHTSCTRG